MDRAAAAHDIPSTDTSTVAAEVNRVPTTDNFVLLWTFKWIAVSFGAEDLGPGPKAVHFGR